jgi:hypothetical protein
MPHRFSMIANVAGEHTRHSGLPRLVSSPTAKWETKFSFSGNF